MQLAEVESWARRKERCTLTSNYSLLKQIIMMFVLYIFLDMQASEARLLQFVNTVDIVVRFIGVILCHETFNFHLSCKTLL